MGWLKGKIVCDNTQNSAQESIANTPGTLFHPLGKDGGTLCHDEPFVIHEYTPNDVPPCNPYEDMGVEVGRLVQAKNVAYGDSYAKSGDVLRVLYPDGITPAQYTDMLAIVRVLDKLFRVATRKDAFGESPWRDIAGYGILGAVNDAERQSIRTDEFTSGGLDQ